MKELATHRFFWDRGTVGDGRGYSVKLSVKLLLEPRDIWVGIYWTPQHDSRDHFFVYLCLLPCLPIRFHWARSWGGSYSQGAARKEGGE